MNTRSPTAKPRTLWAPEFVDYLFLAFNTSTAFSPTDTAVLSRSAKLGMMAQSIISLMILVIIAARAVNILLTRPLSLRLQHQRQPILRIPDNHHLRIRAGRQLLRRLNSFPLQQLRADPRGHNALKIRNTLRLDPLSAPLPAFPSAE